METNNKYYTPDITEFRIGFECEIWRNKTTLEIENPLVTDNVEWTKSIIKTPMSGHMINWQNWPSIKYLLKIGSIRCKFLDKEDIESFGFKSTKHNGVDCFEYDNHFRIFWFNKAYNPQVISIHKFIDDIPHEEQLYKGYILNKSEMKFILIRLGII